MARSIFGSLADGQYSPPQQRFSLFKRKPLSLDDNLADQIPPPSGGSPATPPTPMTPMDTSNMNTEQDSGQDEAPKKQSIFGRAKDWLLGTDEPAPQPDEFGITAPQKHNKSGIMKILEYALPAIATQRLGAGIVPGLMMGRLLQGAPEKTYQKEVENYAKLRKVASEAALGKQKNETDAEYKQRMANAASVNARAHMTSAGASAGLAGERIKDMRSTRLSPDETAALATISPEEKEFLSKMTDAQLITNLGHPDPTKRAVYNALFKMRGKSKLMGRQMPVLGASADIPDEEG